MISVSRTVTIWLVIFCVVLCVECTLPNDLSNFQNEYVCDTSVRLVRPRTISDVRKAVKRHARVVPVGVGHSFNKRFFCARPTSKIDKTTANIVMSTIRPLKIKVNEKDLSAWISAGVTIWDLMSYLGNYVTESSPRGYALGAVPLHVNQTIAGAIATNTHGSSLQHGSLSNQVIGFKVVLANGSLAEIYPDSHPLYFKAFQVSVGRLGVVTDVKMRIIRETLVKMTLRIGVPQEEVVPQLKEAQDLYKSSGIFPEWLQSDVTFSILPTNFTFVRYSLEEVENAEPIAKDNLEQAIIASQATLAYIDAKTNAPINLSRTDESAKIVDGVKWKAPVPFPPQPALQDPASAQAVVDRLLENLIMFTGNATLETHEAALVTPGPLTLDYSLLRDDYEVAVSVENMADCLQGFLELLESLAPDTGIRSHMLLRFSKKEEGFLSVSHDKPVLWFGLQDFVYYSQEPRARNEPHRRLMAYLVANESCSPNRLHWGKPGWPDVGCWNGAELFKDTWCDFGCAVRDLDPSDKFIGSAPDIWNWKGANLEKCCNEDGYDTSLGGCDCDVVPIRTPDECPEAPYYTNK